MKSHSRTVLAKILRALVEEWGQQLVALELQRVCTTAQSKDDIRSESSRSPRSRLKAAEQVSDAHLPERKRSALEAIAIRYDQKNFLPSIADVREFLILFGDRPGSLKDRSDAFRRVLKTLVDLPEDRLEQIASSERFAGPSRLGPIAEAITAASGSMTRSREPSDS